MAERRVEGRIVETLPNALYAVALDDGQRVLTHLSGDLEHRWTRLIPGDRVTVALSPYDRTRGRIVARHR